MVNATGKIALRPVASGNVLNVLRELRDRYLDAFYNGSANYHLMGYLKDPPSFDFWYHYAYLFLAPGLKWAVLLEIKETTVNAASES